MPKVKVYGFINVFIGTKMSKKYPLWGRITSVNEFEVRTFISKIGVRDVYLPGTGIGDVHL